MMAPVQSLRVSDAVRVKELSDVLEASSLWLLSVLVTVMVVDAVARFESAPLLTVKVLVAEFQVSHDDHVDSRGLNVSVSV